MLQNPRGKPHHPSSPFKEKEKEGKGIPKVWWPMEGEGEGSFLLIPTFPPNNFT